MMNELAAHHSNYNKKMTRSFLLEHGFLAVRIMVDVDFFPNLILARDYVS